jgi:hypothetical protein
MDWRPIATAPQDGTFVLLRGGSTKSDYAFWDEPDDGSSRAVVGKWDGEDWVYAFWDSAWRSAYYNPTEWALIE